MWNISNDNTYGLINAQKRNEKQILINKYETQQSTTNE